MKDKFIDTGLVAHTTVDDTTVACVLSGEARGPSPETSLRPYFLELTESCKEGNRRLEIDFRAVDFINSRAIAVILKFLLAASEERVSVVLRYSSSKKWQMMAFSALTHITSQLDGIEVEAVE